MHDRRSIHNVEPSRRIEGGDTRGQTSWRDKNENQKNKDPSIFDPTFDKNTSYILQSEDSSYFSQERYAFLNGEELLTTPLIRRTNSQ